MKGVLAVLVFLLASGPLHAADTPESQGRSLYRQGEQEFAAAHFQAAYDAFRKGYMLLRLPAFLYNMSSALERLDRPHEAAEELRAYLRAVGTVDNHADIEGRIRALDEAQRLIDADRLKNEPPVLVAMPAVPPRWNHRKTVITALSITGAVVVIGGLGIGLGLGLHREYVDSTLGTHPVTP